mmetsp:Transcript_72446/g.125611  ORF Transcript_72446/g.125611 Transcript_72446/m.125611 type:complete len:228 (-) Transcript_72446:170-853(-)
MTDALGSTATNQLLRTGNPETQTDWHNTYRDMINNMYRTSYQDMIHGREVSVKNDYPAGYGGHVPSIRHDVLFRNTEFDRMHESLRSNPARDVFPSFREQNEGVPAHTRFPRGVKTPPSAETGPNVLVKPPWALTLTLREPPTFRTSPPGTARPMSTPRAFQSPRSARVNAAAVTAGQSLTFNVDRSPSDTSDFKLARAVESANATAKQATMPSEEAIFRQSVNAPP